MNRIKLVVVNDENNYKFYYTNKFNLMSYIDKLGYLDRYWDKSKIFWNRMNKRFGNIV